jgi:hypothetical protein
MMEKNKIVYIFSFSFFIIITLALKFTGYYSRLGAGAYYPPLNWEEYFNKLPELLLSSLIVGIVIDAIYNKIRMKKVIMNSIKMFFGLLVGVILIAKTIGLSTSRINPMSWSEIFGERFGGILFICIGSVILYLYVEYYNHKKKKK